MHRRSRSTAITASQNASQRIWPAMFSLCFFVSVLIVMLRYG